MKLFGHISVVGSGPPRLVRLTRNRHLPAPARSGEALLLGSADSFDDAPPGFAAVLAVGREAPDVSPTGVDLAVGLGEEFGYLAEGDILRLNPGQRQARVLYRRGSRFNSLLVTERCNSNCVMCSQPPKGADDGFLLDEILAAIPLMSPETPEIGITGGEPTLLHGGLLRIIERLRDCLPATGVHVLSNGRLLAYTRYAQRIAEARHPDLMIGVPLYSDLPAEHDFVVQARGAFDQTVRGLLNLGRFGVRIELRVVIHRRTFARLPQLAEFIARNLPFVDQVALMGLEMMGYVKMNLGALWIDPVDYRRELHRCVDTLTRGGVTALIYNHQLCVLDRSLWPFARRSISDWKNIYLPECDRCAVRDQCGGFFASATLRHSDQIRAVEPGTVAAGEPT